MTDTSGQALLTADLTAPDKFVFFLKKDISTSDIHASVQINSESQHARLRLDASGLATDSAYSLALNDVTVTSANSDAHGRVRIGWELEGLQPPTRRTREHALVREPLDLAVLRRAPRGQDEREAVR